MSEKSIQTSIFIEGMHCASCAAGIEKRLRRIQGVLEASVNIASEKAFVRYDPGEISVDIIYRAIESAGFTPVRGADELSFESAQKVFLNNIRSLRNRFIAAAILSCFLIVLPLFPVSSVLIRFFIATAVIVCGRSFFISGGKAVFI